MTAVGVVPGATDASAGKPAEFHVIVFPLSLPPCPMLCTLMCVVSTASVTTICFADAVP